MISSKTLINYLTLPLFTITAFSNSFADKIVIGEEKKDISDRLLEKGLKIIPNKNLSATSVGKPNPNIIYILCDDAGYGDFGIYGQKEIKTPNIDQLAKNGIKFTRHYAGSTVSAPSRCSLLTGFNTGNSYIRGNREYFPEGQEPLAENVKTIAQMIKENKNTAHYKTAVIGKWGLGGPNTVGEPYLKGFDYNFGYLCQRKAHTYYPDYLWEGTDNKKSEKLEPSVPKYSDENYSHTKITEKALSFIQDKNAKNENYFLFLTYTIPHAALELPEKYIEKFGYEKKSWPSKMKKFAAMISLMDYDIGRVVELTKNTNTIIMFASDNGPHSEGEANPKFFNSSGNLKGQKRDLYDGGVRVPFIVNWENVIKSAESNHISAFWDFVPTVADILELENMEGKPTNGISFAATIFNKPQEKHKFLYWEFHEQGGKQAVLKENYKLIRLNAKTKPRYELYDLNKDPKEKIDILCKEKNIATELLYIMKFARTENKIFKDFKEIK